MNKFKQNLIKEVQEKIKDLQLGLQKPLINEFTKIDDCRNILSDLQSMMIRFKMIKEIVDFNNKNEVKNGK